MKIVTLTLNPAFDMHCFADNFRPYHESVAEITSLEAGGKGVNVSRALVEIGVENLAVVVVGKENGDSFLSALEKDGLTCAPVWTEGRIRENVTLHEKNNPETRISFNGFASRAGLTEEVKRAVGKVDEDTVVTFTGSMPKGMKKEEAVEMLEFFRKKGAKIVIDSRSFELSDLLSFKPWLVKPNKDEAAAYFSTEVESVEDAAKIARELRKSGIENALVSLGGDGAAFDCFEGAFYAKAPSIPVRSTIGAGDSMIAGFLAATAAGLSKADVLRRAVAYGTSACLSEGTRPPKREDVEKIERRVEVVRL